VETPTQKYWELRLQSCKDAFEQNNFEAFIAQTPVEAGQIVIDQILPAINVKSVSYGDSLTLFETGVLKFFKKNSNITLIDTFDKKASREEIIERRRKALLSDLFLSGTNAVVEFGALVNLDMVGNRVGGMVFGPKWVVIMVGRNKIVSDLEQAMDRIKNLAAPATAWTATAPLESAISGQSMKNLIPRAESRLF
jgi:L-lactate utilization protein LutB